MPSGTAANIHAPPTRYPRSSVAAVAQPVPMSASPTTSPTLPQECRSTFKLALPLVFGHVATALIGFTDSVLAGRHSANTLAGVAVGTALWNVVVVALVGVLLAIPPSVSQLDGAGRRDEVPALFRQALWLALGLAALLIVFIWLVTPALPSMGITPDVQPAARAFLSAIIWGVPGIALFLTMRYTAEGLHHTLPTMLLGAAGLLVLVPLGSAWMFGWWGFPELGAAGLGYATALMVWCQAIAFALYLKFSRRYAALRLFGTFQPPRWESLRSLLKLGLPIGVTVALEAGLFIATALLIGRIEQTQVAAHQIAINVGTITFMAALALAEATTVRVGHAAGAGDAAGIRRAAKAGYVLVLGFQCTWATLIALNNHGIAAIYTQDTAVQALAATLLLFTAAFQISDGVQVVSGAALRGIKDTRVPMLLAALSYWGVGMLVGAGLGLWGGYGAPGMWVGLVVGLSVAAVLLTWRFAHLARRMA